LIAEKQVLHESNHQAKTAAVQNRVCVRVGGLAPAKQTVAVSSGSQTEDFAEDLRNGSKAAPFRIIWPWKCCAKKSRDKFRLCGLHKELSMPVADAIRESRMTLPVDSADSASAVAAELVSEDSDTNDHSDCMSCVSKLINEAGLSLAISRADQHGVSRMQPRYPELAIQTGSPMDLRRQKSSAFK
jgi:hypothetical protein